jgi:hypothetical protein
MKNNFRIKQDFSVEYNNFIIFRISGKMSEQGVWQGKAFETEINLTVKSEMISVLD